VLKASKTYKEASRIGNTLQAEMSENLAGYVKKEKIKQQTTIA